MFILLGLIFGAVAGVALHFALPHTETRGPVLAPAIGATAGGAVWLVMTWLGMSESPWIWLAAVVVPIAVTWPVIVILTRTRLAHDQRERIRLKIA